jgi:hypothetical protein
MAAEWAQRTGRPADELVEALAVAIHVTMFPLLTETTSAPCCMDAARAALDEIEA